MRKYYASQIFQDVAGEYGLAGAWHHAFQTDYPGVDYKAGEIKSGPDGIPTEKALLVLVAATHHSEFAANPRLVQIPAGRDSLIVQVGAGDTPAKLKFRNKLESIGLTRPDVEALTDNPRSWKQVVDDLGKRNNPDFDADNFDLDES